VVTDSFDEICKGARVTVIQPDDVVVFEMPGAILTPEAAQVIRDRARKFFGNNEIVVVNGNVRVQAKADLDNLAGKIVSRSELRRREGL
jgi:fructose-1-phosphate kinase PfkB-like protein